MLVPFALAGLWYGNRIHRRISRDSVLRLLSTPLLPISASSLARVFAG